MPNPFPGMDPYLEGPFWSVFHHNLIDEIARQLAGKLPPRYLALTEERVVLAKLDPLEQPSLRVPDVAVFAESNAAWQPASATAASTVVKPPLVLRTAFKEPLIQGVVEIVEVDTRQLVTTIEVLSPSNKRGDGLVEYQKKREEIVSSTAHLLEIDLLRVGERFPVQNTLPSLPYFVFLSRADRRSQVEVWPISLVEPLPTVPVPLLAGDDDVLLALQQAYETIYNLFHYDRAVNHVAPPRVPLSPEQAAWADACLQ